MGVIPVHYNCLYTLILQCVAYIENTTRGAVQLRGATSHHHPPPLCCAYGSETAPPCAESVTHGHARRSGCVLLRGSGQPAPPACCSRLRSAGCAVCPSRRFVDPQGADDVAVGKAVRLAADRLVSHLLRQLRTPCHAYHPRETRQFSHGGFSRHVTKAWKRRSRVPSFPSGRAPPSPIFYRLATLPLPNAPTG